MLTYCRGSDLYSLADQLIKDLDEMPLKNVLSPETFVVQNHGMAHWLSLYLSREKGIAANLEFEFPAERIWKLIRAINPDIPESLPSDRQPMTWSLMHLLQDQKVLSKFENLAYYVNDQDAGHQAMRIWKLSSKIADVFDQYLLYRPDLILQWENGQIEDKNDDTERWQSRLWRLLNSHWKMHYDQQWLHRAQLQQNLIDQLIDNSIDPSQLPARVTVFGVSAMPPIFVEIFTSLARLVDVNIYQLSVAPIGDEDSFEHPLLESLASQGADFAQILKSQITKLEGGVEEKILPEEILKENLFFQTVQKDLKNNSAVLSEREKSIKPDTSISVHSCHSPMREVEVLYDQLLARLDEDPGLNPNEILIMCPDLETYAPMIEAVFESPEEGQPAIPYSITDQQLQSQSSFIDTFIKILNLIQSRFKVSDVMDLLDSEAILAAFEFDIEDISTLQQWVQENRVRWGVDESFKKSMNLPETNSYTWKSGLNSMLLGYMMKPSEDELYDGIYPYNEIETSDSVELAGSFHHLMQKLFRLSELTDSLETPESWQKKFLNIIDNFFPDTEAFYWELSKLRSLLASFGESASLGGYSAKLPFHVVSSWLQQQLEEQSSGGGGIGRGITFSSLRPMRSIPFRMIGMIGMSEGAFPKSKIPIEFDLIQAKPRKGDPNQSEEDRYLFLENLLSTKEALYFSYVGQSNRQDTTYPPSVVLREFLDYLEENYGVKNKELITKHRLQGFSKDYFTGDDLFTYSASRHKIAETLLDSSSEEQAFLNEALPKPDQDWKSLSLHDLISFYQHPAQYLFKNRLGINLSDWDSISDDREPFLLGSLDGYQVGQELLDRFIKDKSLSSYQDHLKARDLLPEGWTGEQAFHEKVEEVRTFGTSLKAQFSQEPLDDIELDVAIGDFRLVGKLSDVYEQSQFSYRLGKIRPKDQIDLWIKHLCFQLVKPENHSGESIFFTLGKNKPIAECRLRGVKDAEAVLTQLLETYWSGIQQCCYFFPESSFAYAEEVLVKGSDSETGLNSASRKWVREWGDYPGEGEDAYNKLIMGSQRPTNINQFEDVSLQFWSPFFEALGSEDQ